MRRLVVPPLDRPRYEILRHRDPAELGQDLDYHLADPHEARVIGDTALTRALAEHTLRRRIDERLRVVGPRFDRGITWGLART